MTIWIDADSCPVRVRQIVCKASLRLSVPLVFVANRPIPITNHELVSFVQTDDKEQSADDYIVAYSKKGDLVITRDIPLAASLVEKGVVVINDRGFLFTADNVRERLSVRDFMYEVRSNGLMTDRMGVFNKKDIQNFSNTFDSVLTKLIKSESCE
ncbi:MAG: YaiI/YqxD family protein [Treponema sp.]